MVHNPATGELRQDDKGREIPDPNPIEIPAGMKRPETLAEQVQRLVRRQVSDYAAMHGKETFEEADDLEIDEEFDPSSPFELEFDPVLGREITAADFQDAQRREYLREQYLLAERNAIRAETRQDHLDEAYKAARKASVTPKVPPSQAPDKTAPTGEKT
jgi:hypothetical protein